jgi:hypothetical protein
MWALSQQLVNQGLSASGVVMSLMSAAFAATFIGRIDGVPDDVHAFHLKRKDMNRADFLGFGQMGLFDGQFVVQSVEQDAVLEKFPPIPKPEPSKPPKS